MWDGGIPPFRPAIQITVGQDRNSGGEGVRERGRANAMGIFERMSKLGIHRLVITPTNILPAKPSVPGTSWVRPALRKEGHEKLVLICHPEVKLRAAIAIHDRTLGRQSMGGCRVLDYPGEEEMLRDVLDLSRAMTYKAALAGLERGGGKCVVWCDPRTEKTPALLRRLAEEVEQLHGEYIICEDMNFTPQDILVMREKTAHVAGLPKGYHKGTFRGSGAPSETTAQGVLIGMKACLRFLDIGDLGALRGKTVAIQGLGHVGFALARLLHQEGASLVACDVDESRTAQFMKEFAGSRSTAGAASCRVVPPKEIFSQQCDIFAPCAAGGAISPKTIRRLQCRIVAGAANNQLANEQAGRMLVKRGILYAPDYVINAGGLINLDAEIHPQGYSAARVQEKLENIYYNLLRIFWYANRLQRTPAEVADLFVEETIHFQKIHFPDQESSKLWSVAV